MQALKLSLSPSPSLSLSLSLPLPLPLPLSPPSPSPSLSSLSLSLLRSRKDSPQFFSRSCDWVLSIVRNYRSAFEKLVPVSSHDVPGDSIFINTMTCNLRERGRE